MASMVHSVWDIPWLGMELRCIPLSLSVISMDLHCINNWFRCASVTELLLTDKGIYRSVDTQFTIL